MPDICIKDLYKTYGEKPVLTGLNLTLQEGKSNIIMGASGCGKTTLLRILMGLEQQDSGTVTGMPERFGAVFQEDRLCEDFSAVTNVKIVQGKQAGEAQIRKHLEQIGLGDSMDQPVRELSGGMKRRTAIVRAVMADVPLVFFDEPFKGLDQETKKTVMEYVREEMINRTMVLVTHDPEESTFFDGNVMTI